MLYKKGPDVSSLQKITIYTPLNTAVLGAVSEISYAARLKSSLDCFTTLRNLIYGDSEKTLFSVSANTVSFVRSFRLAFSPQNSHKLLVSVELDCGLDDQGMRFWEENGVFLDIIFCHCRDYPLSVDSDYPMFKAWLGEYVVDENTVESLLGDHAWDLVYLQKNESAKPIEHLREHRGRAGLYGDDEALKANSASSQNAKSDLLDLGLRALLICEPLRNAYSAPKDDALLVNVLQNILCEMRPNDVLIDIPLVYSAKYQSLFSWFDKKIFWPNKISTLGNLSPSNILPFEQADSDAKASQSKPSPSKPSPPKPKLEQTESVIEQVYKLNPADFDSEVDLGHQVLRILKGAQSEDDWKLIIEDTISKQKGYRSAVFSVIRHHYGGIYDAKPHFGVIVTDWGLMQKVLDDEATFSVAEVSDHSAPTKHKFLDSYLFRMNNSLGKIYLGLDDSDEYRNLSEETNKAIQSIDLGSAFEKALQATEEELQSLRAVHGENTPLALMSIAEKVLASMCQHWFDLPDGQVIRFGGRPENASDTTLNCPFHYILPSKFIFSPCPGEELKHAGRSAGKALSAATGALFEKGQLAGQGPVSRAVLDKFLKSKNGSDEEQIKTDISSTLVGVMMGFLPTGFGSILTVLATWVVSGRFWDIQEAYLKALKSSGSKLDSANQSFTHALVETLRNDPTPEMFWRTVKLPGKFGSSKNSIDMEIGDKLVFCIAGETQMIKKQEYSLKDLYPIFGGERKIAAAGDPAESPTHACPGFVAAIGVYFGLIAGLMQAGELRPAGSPLLLEWI